MNIVIYSKVGCTHCEEVKAILDQNQLDYEVLEYQTDFDKEEFVEIFDESLDFDGNDVKITKQTPRPNAKGFPRILVETASGFLFFDKKGFIEYLGDEQ